MDDPAEWGGLDGLPARRLTALLMVILTVVAGCTGGAGTEKSPNLEGEIGVEREVILAEGTDDLGADWRIRLYERPNGRECVQLSYPELNDTESSGFCASYEFLLSLADVSWIRFHQFDRQALFGLLSPQVDAVEVHDDHSPEPLRVVRPVATRTNRFDGRVFVLSNPPRAARVIELHDFQGALLERIAIAPPPDRR